jgi:hypothetical protein
MGTAARASLRVACVFPININKDPPVTADRRAAGASPLTEAEQNRLIVENMKLAPAVAASYRGGSIAFDELVAVGRFGTARQRSKYRFQVDALRGGSKCLEKIRTGTAAPKTRDSFYFLISLACLATMAGWVIFVIVAT